VRRHSSPPPGGPATPALLLRDSSSALAFPAPTGQPRHQPRRRGGIRGIAATAAAPGEAVRLIEALDDLDEVRLGGFSKEQARGVAVVLFRKGLGANNIRGRVS